MREFFGRLSAANKVGVIGAFMGYLVGMGVIVAVKPVDGLVIFAGSSMLVVFCVWFFFGREFRRSRVLKEGEAAEATILSVRSTGVTINEVYPEIELLLEVRPAQGAPYQVKTKLLVDQVDIPGYQPGNVIAVTVDRKNKRKVAVGLKATEV